MSVDLNDLSFENIASWPRSIKFASVIMACLVGAALFYWVDCRKLTATLHREALKETELKQKFERKFHLVTNIDSYNEQLSGIQDSFDRMLKKLPGESEVPALLEDISKMGVASGLEFKLFRPMPASQSEFYTELPIKVSVIGNYDQLARFINKLSNSDRIVTLHDFILKKMPDGPKVKTNRLLMDMTAKTYWYSGSRSQKG